MLNRLKKYRLDFAGSTFNGDRGYDGNKNFQSMFNMNMLPNIKQRKNSKNKKAVEEEQIQKEGFEDIQCINISL